MYLFKKEDHLIDQVVNTNKLGKLMIKSRKL